MTESFIPRMQSYRGKRLDKFVDENMLTNALKKDPQKISQAISYIYATKYEGYSTVIDLLTGYLGHKIELESQSYEWNLDIEDKFSIPKEYEKGSDESSIPDTKFRNYLTTVRMKIDIPSSAKNDVLAYALKDPTSGHTSYLWGDYQLWLATRKFMERIEYQLLTDQTTVSEDGTFHLKGKNGCPIKRGAGIDQQISPGNLRYYHELNFDILDSFLMDLSNNISGIENRKFVLLTGEMGMREIDKAIKSKLGSMQLIDTHFVTSSGQNLNLSGQFTSYKMTNGIELSCKVLSFLDDPNHNRIVHPLTKRPVRSYDIYILDNGFRNGKTNIQKIVKKKREFLQWVVPGSSTPSGFHKSTPAMGASSIDGYSVYFLAEIGVVILDPRGCGIMKCAVDK